MRSQLARYSALLPGAAMAVLIAAGIVATPPAAYVAAIQSGPIDDVRRLVEGHYTEAFEDLYANELFGRDLSINLWGAVDFALFGEGTSKVVVGRDGWLYTAEEFEQPAGHAANLDRNLLSVRHAKARLDQLGIDLLVAVVPPKTAIYPDRLVDAPPPNRLAARQRFLAGLDAAGVAHVYLEAALRPTRDSGQTFMARDSHWSPEGAAAAGKALEQVDSDGLRTRVEALSLRSADDPRARQERDRLARTIADLDAIEAQQRELLASVREIDAQLDSIAAAVGRAGSDDGAGLDRLAQSAVDRRQAERRAAAAQAQREQR